jgi:hypothetical protein
MSLAFYYSGGGAATSVLGGAISSVAVAETEGAVFPNVLLADAVTGITHFASIYIKNTGATTITHAWLYFASNVGNSKVYFAKGITANLTIANDTTAPTDALVFQKPAYLNSAVDLGSLAAGASQQLWLKRVVAANATGSPQDYFILTGAAT